MAKHKVMWGSNAKDDLMEILSNLLDQFGTTSYCKNITSKFNRTIKVLSKNPLVGSETDQTNVRLMVSDDYQIFYEIMGDTILIAMICEGRKIDISKNYSLKAKGKNVSKIIFE